MRAKQFALLFFVLCCGCTEYYPKPKALLRVDAAERYQVADSLSFARFQTLSGARILPEKESGQEVWINILYPFYNAEFYGTYRRFSAPKELTELCDDFYKLLDRNVRDEEVYYAHFEDAARATYGYLYWSDAPIPSPVQFFVTDSARHFFRGAVYFSDSLSYEMRVPYARAFSDEMMRLIESFNWK